MKVIHKLVRCTYCECCGGYDFIVWSSIENDDGTVTIKGRANAADSGIRECTVHPDAITELFL